MPIMIPPGQGVTVTTPAGQEQVVGMQAAQAMLPRTQQAPSPFREVHGPDLVIMPHEGETKPPAQPTQSQPQQQPAQMSRMPYPVHLDADSGAISDPYGFHKPHGTYGFPQEGPTPKVSASPDTNTDWGAFRNFVNIGSNNKTKIQTPASNVTNPSPALSTSPRTKVTVIPPKPPAALPAPKVVKQQPIIYTSAVSDAANVNSSMNPMAITNKISPRTTPYSDIFRKVMGNKATGYAKNAGVLSQLLKTLRM